MGNQLYKKVEAVIHIERKEYNISGSINYDMIDGQSFRQIHSGTVTSGFSKFIERAKYTGDSRALDVEDWNLINNTKYNYSNDVEVEEELYRRIYPELLRRIKYDVDW